MLDIPKEPSAESQAMQTKSSENEQPSRFLCVQKKKRAHLLNNVGHFRVFLPGMLTALLIRTVLKFGAFSNACNILSILIFV